MLHTDNDRVALGMSNMEMLDNYWGDHGQGGETK
jgi:hypothetical protein